MKDVLLIIACVAFCKYFNVLTLLLGMMALCMKLRTSALAGPMLIVNCPTFRSLT